MIETYFMHTCKNCEGAIKLYHLNWTAIACRFCRHEIPIKDINNKSTEIVTNIYKNTKWQRIN